MSSACVVNDVPHASPINHIAAISVDLDSLTHYCRIHGIDEVVLDDQARCLIASTAIPRLLDLFHRAQLPATFFVIGADAMSVGMPEALTYARRAGVELASHSFSHDYAISRWAPGAILADIVRAEEAIQAAADVRPVGFRAPGYTMSPALLQAIENRGYSYDSSIFPSAPYYVSKALVMGLLAAMGRPSRAILDSPRVLFAPRSFFRPSLTAPYQHGDAALVELPVAVAPVTRLPFIGTFVTTMPWRFVKALFRSMSSDLLFNFELHAIDVLDESDGVPAVLAQQQRDLKVPVRQKLARLRCLFSWLAHDRQCVSLIDASRIVAPCL